VLHAVESKGGVRDSCVHGSLHAIERADSARADQRTTEAMRSFKVNYPRVGRGIPHGGPRDCIQRRPAMSLNVIQLEIELA
jgi:hypothetical protein